MKKNNNPILYMQNHYFHRQDFSTLQEMLYFVGNEYSDKPAFILKDIESQNLIEINLNIINYIESNSDTIICLLDDNMDTVIEIKEK